MVMVTDHIGYLTKDRRPFNGTIYRRPRHKGAVFLDKEIVFLIEESPEGGYEAKALGLSIFTEGESLDEIRENIRDAVRCHFEEDKQPKVVRLHFVKDEVLAV